MPNSLNAIRDTALGFADGIRERYRPNLPKLSDLPYVQAAFEVLLERRGGQAVAKVMNQRYQLGLMARGSKQTTAPKHTRLEHTCGVMSLAALAVEVLRDKELELSDRDAFLLLMAAAFHDAAHLPVSHAAERGLLYGHKGRNVNVKHEDRVGSLLLNGVLQQWQSIRVDIERYGRLLSERATTVSSVRQVAHLIVESTQHKLGDVTEEQHTPPILSQILSSPIDVDRIDFLYRDAVHTGYRPMVEVSDVLWRTLAGYDYALLSSRENHPKLFQAELAVHEDDLPWSFALLVCRLLMYRNVYFDQSVRVTEGTFTRMFSVLVQTGVIEDPLTLIGLGDDEFLDAYLPDLIKSRESLLTREQLDTVNVDLGQLQSMIPRFTRVASIRVRNIESLPLRSTIQREYARPAFATTLRQKLISLLSEHCSHLNVSRRFPTLSDEMLLVDPFIIKAESGDPLWVISDTTGRSGADKFINRVNGSNIHGLVEDERIDLYFDNRFVGRSDPFPGQVVEVLQSYFGKDAVTGELK